MPLPPPPLPVAVTSAVQTAGGTTAALSSLASPAAAVQVTRVLGVLAMAERCTGGLSRATGYSRTNPGFPQSLAPGFGFGAEGGYYFRGAIVGNTLLLTVVSGLSLVVGALVAKNRSMDVTFFNIVTAARLPGSLVLFYAMGLDGTITAAFVLLLADGGAPPSDVFLAMFAFVFYACIFGLAIWCIRHILALAAQPAAAAAHDTSSSSTEEEGTRAARIPLLGFCRLQVLRRKPGETAAVGENMTWTESLERQVKLSRPMRFCLFGYGAWLPQFGTDITRGERELNRYGIVPRHYRWHLPIQDRDHDEMQPSSSAHSITNNGEEAGHHPPSRREPRGSFRRVLHERVAELCPWFLVADMFLTIGVCFAQALTMLDCTKAAKVALASNAIGLFLACVLRPYAVPLKNTVMMLVNCLTLIASAFMVAAMESSDATKAEAISRVGSSAAAGAAVISTLAMLPTAVRIVLVMKMWRAVIVPLRSESLSVPLLDAKMAAAAENRGSSADRFSQHADGGESILPVELSVLHTSPITRRHHVDLFDDPINRRRPEPSPQPQRPVQRNPPSRARAASVMWAPPPRPRWRRLYPRCPAPWRLISLPSNPTKHPRPPTWRRRRRRTISMPCLIII